ncbi:5-hydroxytryptamine receptor 3A isoform X1 [Xenopus laevis]|uniref:5-hydroxytryptamine receptor 3A isoform X1 n=2 Tax=Xenopus laevis TaxID=8355 RepID=A0A8J0V109_XENLA|nr:5-hydroxytryptamine receptor 3A isoform X1 [Xenopus laevis]
MDLQLLSFLLIGTWLGLGCCENNCSYVELMKAINDNFPSTHVRPAMIWTNRTVVHLDLTLYSIVDLDMQKQILTTYIWFSMSWQNDFVKWDPKTYCDIQNVVVPDTLVWKPDLYIYEMVEDEDKSPKINYLKIKYDGTVTNSKPLRIVGSCSMQNYKFPFDEQICNISFGSYVYNDYQIYMTNKTNSSVVTSNSKVIFSSKGDWSLANIKVGNNPLGNFSRVTFEIHIIRNPIIYVFNLIIPACLLVILDIASMFMELETEGRLTFKVTIVLGFSVLLLILSGILPNSDTPPMLGIFFCVCMIMMVLSIGGSICTASMAAKCATQTSVSPWMRKWILRYLACVLCYKTKFIKEHLVTVVANIHTCELDQKLTKNLELQENRNNLKDDDDPITTAVQILNKMLVGIRKIHQEIVVSKHKDHSSSEWYIAAMVVDRLFLIIYLIIVVITVGLVINAWIS